MQLLKEYVQYILENKKKNKHWTFYLYFIQIIYIFQ